MKKGIFAAIMLFSAIPMTHAEIFPALACRVNAEANPQSLGMGPVTNLNPKVLNLAMRAYNCARKMGYNDPRRILTIIDYTLPSTEKRLWVIDLQTRKVIFNTLVAQGKYTGDLYARYFSDQPQSKESSIGLFVTEQPYVGHDGYALRINGLDKGFNDKAEERDIVVHGAWYVSESFARRMGRIGKSWGCLAVPKDMITPMINQIKDGTLVFSYYPNPQWLAQSKFLHCPTNVTYNPNLFRVPTMGTAPTTIIRFGS